MQRHRADGTKSMDRWLADNHQSLAETLRLSAQKMTWGNCRNLLDYLADGTAAPMPEGLVFWTAD